MLGGMVNSLDTSLREILLWSLGKMPDHGYRLSQMQVAKSHYDALLIHVLQLI